MTSNSPFIRNLSMSFEAAHEAIAEMKDHEVTSINGVDVHSGQHPTHGNIHIVIPAMGNGLMLLPFAFHDLEV